jgi:hypothetical protein
MLSLLSTRVLSHASSSASSSIVGIASPSLERSDPRLPPCCWADGQRNQAPPTGFEPVLPP